MLISNNNKLLINRKVNNNGGNFNANMADSDKKNIMSTPNQCLHYQLDWFFAVGRVNRGGLL